MKFLAFLLLVSVSCIPPALAGNLFAPQDYGRSFNSGFNNMQSTILRQRQLEQLQRDREYQEEMLRIEKERLAIEREKAARAKPERENGSDSAQGNEREELAAYLASLFKFNPEYESEEARETLLMAAVFLSGLEENKGKSQVEVLELAHAAIQQKKHKDTFDEFCRLHPEFSDESSKIRKYGDYVYDTNFAQRVASGEMSYSDALKATAVTVNELFPLPSLLADKQAK